MGRQSQRVFLSTFYLRVRLSLFDQSGICFAIRVLFLQFHNEIVVFKSFEWGTVSNVLLQSNTAMCVWVPVLKEEKRSCMVVRSCVSREKPALKPWLRSVMMLCSSR